MIPILQKCLTELNEEVPNTDYIRGMLEAIIETSNHLKPTAPIFTASSGAIAHAQIPGNAMNLAEIKKMAGEV